LEEKILFWTGAGHFFNHVGNYLTPALLIYLQSDIALTHTDEGILGSIPMILLVFLSTGVGWLGDKYPYLKKHLIWLGIFGLGIFSILMSAANTFNDLMIATIVLGISLSTYHPIAFTILNNMSNKDRNMGINSVCGNIGSAITPLFAMLFSVLINWRGAFLLFASFQIITGLLMWFLFPNEQVENPSNRLLNEGKINDKHKNSTRNVISLVLLLVLISAFRAPVFRCISYFTTIVFNSAFSFNRIESSILTAITLGVGAFSTFLIGYINNKRISKGVSRSKRVEIRINSILLSNGVSSIFLILLVIIPSHYSLIIFLVYILLTFFFFLGAAILPTIMSEISPNAMGSSLGILFSGATLTGAIAPTIFGSLADTYGFEASFLFLDVVALLCVFFIIIFKIVFRKIEETLP
jgi:MFS family permease